MPLTDFYGKNRVLDGYLGTGSPLTVYFALCKTTPASTDTGADLVEPASNYARASADNNRTTWPLASSGSMHNGIEIAFPEAAADWGEVRALAIVDAATGGNVLGFGQLQPARVVSAGQILRLPVNTITIAIE